MKDLIKKILKEEYFESRQPVEGYVDAEEIMGQRLWFHTNRTHRNNGWNGMVGIYDTTGSGRKTGYAGRYTNEVRIGSPIHFQTSDTGAERIKQSEREGKIKRVLIAGVSGIVIPTRSGEVGGMTQVMYDPTERGVGYFHEISDPDKKEIISASEVYFNASEDGRWSIYVKDPIYSERSYS
jgi:hypothetical protein